VLARTDDGLRLGGVEMEGAVLFTDLRGFTSASEHLLRDSGLGEGFKMAVGVNSGPFMSGNIGSAQGLAYTAMGDTINTASRIDDQGTPYMLFVYSTRSTWRGRTTKLKLWALPTPGPPA
jgi:class 3 adenylate cyclase